MAEVNEKIDIVADRVTVFNVYVNRIDEWWPRRGDRYRYSFAPESTAPAHIRFEPRAGGRFYEVFEDGSEYDIGSVETYDPPNEFVYTWRAPSWERASRVQVRFAQNGDTTTVMVNHTGFPSDDVAQGYGEGLREILGVFARFVATEEG